MEKVGGVYKLQQDEIKGDARKGTYSYIWTVKRGVRHAYVYKNKDSEVKDYVLILRNKWFNSEQVYEKLTREECDDVIEKFLTRSVR